jgi:hypothetical protein
MILLDDVSISVLIIRDMDVPEIPKHSEPSK